MAAHESIITLPAPTNPQQYLRVELSSLVLLRLLSEGRLCAAEFRCLDAASHRTARKLLLRSCVGHLR